MKALHKTLTAHELNLITEEGVGEHGQAKTARHTYFLGQNKIKLQYGVDGSLRSILMRTA